MGSLQLSLHRACHPTFTHLVFVTELDLWGQPQTHTHTHTGLAENRLQDLLCKQQTGLEIENRGRRRPRSKWTIWSHTRPL